MLMKSSNSEGIFNNKLTECFDDIMRISTEMLVQQQLKTLQLDSTIVKGYSNAQQKTLSEQIHAFHSFLDGVELTLISTSKYVDILKKSGLERAKLKKEQDELQAKKQRELEDDNSNKNKFTSGLESAISGSLGFDGLPGQNISNDNTINAVDAINGSNSNTNGKNSFGNIPDNTNIHNSNFNTKFDLNDMDLMMFGGIDNQNDFGLSTFDTNSTNPGVDIPSKQDSANVYANTSKQEQTQSFRIDMSNNNGSDNYLTLNDFNDINLDWNATGDNELNLADFNT